MTRLNELNPEQLDSVTGGNAITALANAVVEVIAAGVNALAAPSAGGIGLLAGDGALGGGAKGAGVAPRNTWL